MVLVKCKTLDSSTFSDSSWLNGFVILSLSFNNDCGVCRKEDGVLRTMNAEKLLKTLPALQAQLDALLEFDCTAQDLTNGVINMTFMLLFRDLIRLFAGYNDSIINLLGNQPAGCRDLSRFDTMS